jgi:hypothetical protein
LAIVLAHHRQTTPARLLLKKSLGYFSSAK